MWPFRRPVADQASADEKSVSNAPQPSDDVKPEEYVLAGAARELARRGLGEGIFDTQLAAALVRLVADSGLLTADHRFSVDIVTDMNGAWRFGASTDPKVNSTDFFAAQLGLTGWLIRSRRRILHVVSRDEIPTEVVAVSGYGDVESAFLYLIRLDGDAAACLCLVSTHAGAIPTHLRETLHRLGKLVEVLAASELESTRAQRTRTVYAAPAPRDAHVIDDWIGDRLSLFFKWATFWRWEGNKRGELVPSAFSREIKPWAGVMRPLKVGEGFTGECARVRRLIVENVVTEGVGEQTRLSTPLVDISPGKRLRSILTMPVQDTERFYGVVTILGDTVHHFHDEDSGAAGIVASEIAAILRRIDDRKLLELQHKATASLLSTLNESTPPGQYWPALQRSLQTIVDGGVSTEAFLLVRKRSTGARYSVKAAASSAKEIVGADFDLSHDDVLRSLARADHGEIDLSRLRRRYPSHALIAGQRRAWVATYSPGEGTDTPLLIVVLLLPERSVYSEPFGERQLDHIFDHVTSSAFAFTRIVLMANDFGEITRTHSQLIVSETHDIAQQLTSIKHAAEQLLETQSTSQLKRIVGAADDLLVRIDNMMYQNWFVRSGISVSGPTAQFDEPQAVDIVELLETAVNTVRSRHPECVFTLETHHIHAGVEYLVFGRYRWLAVAVRNVLDNAQKFGRSAPVEIRLEFVPPEVVDGDTMLIAIHDHGIGIPTDQRKAIFQPGHRNPYSRHLFVGGSQIALSVTQDIIQEHHGEIWVESQLRRGSTFYIRLPRYRREVLNENSVG